MKTYAERQMQMEYTAEQVYESFQEPSTCRELVRYLLNSGLLSEILAECAAYAADNENQ